MRNSTFFWLSSLLLLIFCCSSPMEEVSIQNNDNLKSVINSPNTDSAVRLAPISVINLTDVNGKMIFGMNFHYNYNNELSYLLLDIVDPKTSTSKKIKASFYYPISLFERKNPSFLVMHDYDEARDSSTEFCHLKIDSSTGRLNTNPIIGHDFFAGYNSMMMDINSFSSVSDFNFFKINPMDEKVDSLVYNYGYAFSDDLLQNINCTSWYNFPYSLNLLHRIQSDVVNPMNQFNPYVLNLMTQFVGLMDTGLGATSEEYFKLFHFGESLLSLLTLSNGKMLPTYSKYSIVKEDVKDVLGTVYLQIVESITVGSDEAVYPSKMKQKVSGGGISETYFYEIMYKE